MWNAEVRGGEGGGEGGWTEDTYGNAAAVAAAQVPDNAAISDYMEPASMDVFNRI